MKVAVIGATGTIGSAVATALEERGHDVLRLSRNSSPSVDLDDPSSIDRFYAEAGPLDAVVSAAGSAAFGPVDQASDADFELGLQSKLMGQVNLVRKSGKAVKEGGAVVLTSGILAHNPWPNTAAVAMANAGLEGFTRAAALDLGERCRVVTVSPPLVRETAVAMGMDAQGPSAAEVAKAYVRAVEGNETGTVRFVDGFAP